MFRAPEKPVGAHEWYHPGVSPVMQLTTRGQHGCVQGAQSASELSRTSMFFFDYFCVTYYGIYIICIYIHI